MFKWNPELKLTRITDRKIETPAAALARHILDRIGVVEAERADGQVDPHADADVRVVLGKIPLVGIIIHIAHVVERRHPQAVDDGQAVFRGGIPIGSENWSLSASDGAIYTLTNQLTGATRSLDMGGGSSRSYIAQASVNGQGEVLFAFREFGSTLNYATFSVWGADGSRSVGGGIDARAGFTVDGNVWMSIYHSSRLRDYQLNANGKNYWMGNSIATASVLPTGGTTTNMLVSAPHDVNASGLIAGVDRNMAAIRPENGAVTYLPGTGNTSSANSINIVGTVVGSGLTSSNEGFAFIWDEGQGTRDLNQLIDAQSPLAGNVRLDSADYISDDGSSILAYGHYLSDAKATRTAFMLSSVPEPSTYALVGLGLCAIVVARRRQPMR